MNIRQQVALMEFAGTSEGAVKGWDTRGRGKSEGAEGRHEDFGKFRYMGTEEDPDTGHPVHNFLSRVNDPDSGSTISVLHEKDKDRMTVAEEGRWEGPRAAEVVKSGPRTEVEPFLKEHYGITIPRNTKSLPG